MITNLANVSRIVKDYDEAINWWTEVFGLELRMDRPMGGDYRFVTVGGRGRTTYPSSCTSSRGGLQTRRTVSTNFSFHTDDCRGDVERLRYADVNSPWSPRSSPGVFRPFSRTSTAAPTSSSSPPKWPPDP